MRIEEAATPRRRTAQTRARNERVGVIEDVPLDVFSLAWSLASRAAKLPVEGVERFGLWRELIGVPFHQFRRYFRVERLEVHEVERRRRLCPAQ
jgi:hypothetical protein